MKALRLMLAHNFLFILPFHLAKMGSYGEQEISRTTTPAVFTPMPESWLSAIVHKFIFNNEALCGDMFGSAEWLPISGQQSCFLHCKLGSEVCQMASGNGIRKVSYRPSSRRKQRCFTLPLGCQRRLASILAEHSRDGPKMLAYSSRTPVPPNARDLLPKALHQSTGSARHTTELKKEKEPLPAAHTSEAHPPSVWPPSATRRKHVASGGSSSLPVSAVPLASTTITTASAKRASMRTSMEGPQLPQPPAYKPLQLIRNRGSSYDESFSYIPDTTPTSTLTPPPSGPIATTLRTKGAAAGVSAESHLPTVSIIAPWWLSMTVTTPRPETSTSNATNLSEHGQPEVGGYENSGSLDAAVETRSSSTLSPSNSTISNNSGGNFQNKSTQTSTTTGLASTTSPIVTMSTTGQDVEQMTLSPTANHSVMDPHGGTEQLTTTTSVSYTKRGPEYGGASSYGEQMDTATAIQPVNAHIFGPPTMEIDPADPTPLQLPSISSSIIPRIVTSSPLGEYSENRGIQETNFAEPYGTHTSGGEQLQDEEEKLRNEPWWSWRQLTELMEKRPFHPQRAFLLTDKSIFCCQWALDGLCDRSWQRVRQLCPRSCGTVLCSAVDGALTCSRAIDVDVIDCYEQRKHLRPWTLIEKGVATTMKDFGGSAMSHDKQAIVEKAIGNVEGKEASDSIGNTRKNRDAFAIEEEIRNFNLLNRNSVFLNSSALLSQQQ